MRNIIIYTDGACSGNPGPGGWAALLIYKDKNNKEHEKEISGFDKDTTNNKMELTAAIRALQSLKVACNVDLFTDSKYVLQGITEWIHGWKKKQWKDVKNVELWHELEEATKRHKINWYWVKGHSNNIYNNRVDELARNEITKNL